MTTPLARYLDAVTAALAGAGVTVEMDAADEAARMLAIDLAPVTPVRRPTMLWTPDAGWRVAMTCRGTLRAATIRYLASGPVPLPSDVAADVRRWLDDPASLTDVQPVYDTVTHLVDRALAEAAREAP